MRGKLGRKQLDMLALAGGVFRAIVVPDPVTRSLCERGLMKPGGKTDGLIVLTPEGKTSRYFYGVQYDAAHVRLGLVEASENKIGSPVDKLLLFCYHYDPNNGQYNVKIMNVIKIFGVVFVALMVGGIFLLMRRERIDKAREQKPGLPVQG